MKVVVTSIITGIAGSENYFLNALPALQKHDGIDITFIVLTPAREKGKEEKFVQLLTQSGVETKTIYFSKILLSGLYKLSKQLREINPDIVHSHLLYADVVVSLINRFFYKKFKHVTTKHGYEEWYNAKFGFDPSHRVKNKYWRVAKRAEKTVEGGFAVSNALKNLYQGLGISNHYDLKVIHHGFDYDFDLSHKKSNEKLTLVMVGRLTAFKGHKYAIDAATHLVQKNVDFKLQIVGNGPIENELKSMVKEKSLDRVVEFLGYQPNGYEFMINADVVLIPSVAEGFGLVVLEAMAAKTPIVAFDVPAINEALEDKKTGLLVAPYDTIIYADAIQYLSQHPEIRQEIADNAEQHLKSYFSLQRMVEETLQFYQSI